MTKPQYAKDHDWYYYGAKQRDTIRLEESYMTTTKPFALGSVSTGTLRTEDLLKLSDPSICLNQ
jgi:hypothetical protein